ncbi:unnamed protein product, partial [Amoebophrya sp. A25]|eukprot:GSA25T00015745001.1
MDAIQEQLAAALPAETIVGRVVAVQIRLGPAKGMLVVDETIHGKQIVLSKSQVKYTPYPHLWDDFARTIEVCRGGIVDGRTAFEARCNTQMLAILQESCQLGEDLLAVFRSIQDRHLANELRSSFGIRMTLNTATAMRALSNPCEAQAESLQRSKAEPPDQHETMTGRSGVRVDSFSATGPESHYSGDADVVGTGLALGRSSSLCDDEDERAFANGALLVKTATNKKSQRGGPASAVVQMGTALREAGIRLEEGARADIVVNSRKRGFSKTLPHAFHYRCPNSATFKIVPDWTRKLLPMQCALLLPSGGRQRKRLGREDVETVPVRGPVLVMRTPAHEPSQMQMWEAVADPDIVDLLRKRHRGAANLLFCSTHPTLAACAPDPLAGGDMDGDDVICVWARQVVQLYMQHDARC